MLRLLLISLLVGVDGSRASEPILRSIPVKIYSPPELNVDHLLPPFAEDRSTLQANGIKQIVVTSNDGHRGFYDLDPLGRVTSIVHQDVRRRKPSYGYRYEYEYDDHGRISVQRRYFKKRVGDIDSVIWAEDGRYFASWTSWMGNAFARKGKMTRELLGRMLILPKSVTDSTLVLQMERKGIEEDPSYLIDSSGRVIQRWLGDRVDSLYIEIISPDTARERWLTFNNAKGTSRIGMERIIVRNKVIEERFYHDEDHMPEDGVTRWIKRYSYDHNARLLRQEQGHLFLTQSTTFRSYDGRGLPSVEIRILNKSIQYDQYEYYRTTQDPKHLRIRRG